jgi:predicted negative regulator of RcsB-dependent stress response
MHLAVLFLVLVLGFVGFVGYRVTQNAHKTATPDPVASQQSKYTSTADLTKADNSLNTNDVDQSVDTTALDQDVNNML